MQGLMAHMAECGGGRKALEPTWQQQGCVPPTQRRDPAPATAQAPPKAMGGVISTPERALWGVCSGPANQPLPAVGLPLLPGRSSQRR